MEGVVQHENPRQSHPGARHAIDHVRPAVFFALAGSIRAFSLSTSDGRKKKMGFWDW